MIVLNVHGSRGEVQQRKQGKHSTSWYNTVGRPGQLYRPAAGRDDSSRNLFAQGECFSLTMCVTPAVLTKTCTVNAHVKVDLAHKTMICSVQE